jgi:hypothetical protein
MFAWSHDYQIYAVHIIQFRRHYCGIAWSAGSDYHHITGTQP